jgi:hypothetical protein
LVRPHTSVSYIIPLASVSYIIPIAQNLTTQPFQPKNLAFPNPDPLSNYNNYVPTEEKEYEIPSPTSSPQIAIHYKPPNNQPKKKQRKMK